MQRVFFFLSCCLSLISHASGQELMQSSIYPFQFMVGDTIIKAHAKTKSENIKLVEDRFYFWYKGDRIRRTQGGFDGRLLYGQYSSYYLNGNLRTQGEFKDGLQEGKWLDWYKNGTIENKYYTKEGQI